MSGADRDPATDPTGIPTGSAGPGGPATGGTAAAGAGDADRDRDRDRETDKAARRRDLLARRRARPDVDRWRDAGLLAAALPRVLDELGADPRRPVCLYVPVRTEPGATPDGALPVLDTAVALGRRVLLPVTSPDEPAPLDWAGFTDRDDLGPGPFGLLEPTGRRLGPAAIGEAAIVVVPALAASPAGVRLGRGAGHYDRSLPLAAADAALIALVGDDELLGELPSEPHDVPVDGVWRPSSGLLRTTGPGRAGTA